MTLADSKLLSGTLFRSGAVPSPSRDSARVTDLAIGASLFLIAVVSTSNFNPVLLGGKPGTSSDIQQYLTLALWGVIICIAQIQPRRINVGKWIDVYVALAFIVYVTLSCFWSSNYSGVLKASALALTTVGAYALAITTPLSSVLLSVVAGLTVTSLASLAAVILVPSVGLVHDWMHNGQWAGIYESKQSLGGVGAYLMFFSYCRYRVGGSWIGFAFSFLLGVTVVIGSGSRGGGAIAFCSVVVAFLSARSAAFGRLLLFVPFAVALWANALLLGLQSSAARKVTIFGVETDLTERVVIWRYALARLEQHDILGFGINGFWSDPGRYFTFLRENGWVLDNFHSGYLAILIETGLVGASIFLLFLFIYPIRMGLMYKRGNIDPFTFNTTSGVLCLTAIFNITETFFLRSTNLFSVLPVVFYLSSAAAITSAAPSWRADDAR